MKWIRLLMWTNSTINAIWCNYSISIPFKPPSEKKPVLVHKQLEVMYCSSFSYHWNDQSSSCGDWNPIQTEMSECSQVLCMHMVAPLYAPSCALSSPMATWMSSCSLWMNTWVVSRPGALCGAEANIYDRRTSSCILLQDKCLAYVTPSPAGCWSSYHTLLYHK